MSTTPERSEVRLLVREPDAPPVRLRGPTGLGFRSAEPDFRSVDLG